MSASKELIEGGFIQLCTPDGETLPDRKTISEANQEGLWHLSVHVLVVDTSTSMLLAQKRSPFVKIHPGRVELSIGGAVKYGEPLRTACVRELFEEVGIQARPADFRLLFQSKYNHHLTHLGLHSKVILYSYLLLFSKTPRLEFRDDEAVEAKFISFAIASQLASGENISDIGELSPQYGYYQQLLEGVRPFIL